MTYLDWFHTHAQKHKKIVEKLVEKEYSREQIIEYFNFENMLINEPTFCLLYQNNKKCHDIETLNCYLCACPSFRFNDEGLGSDGEFTIFSRCNINKGDIFKGKNAIHHDCSNCSIPHHEPYTKKHFDLDWKKIMSKCHQE